MDFDALLAYFIDTVPMPAKIASVLVIVLAITGGGYAAWRMIQKGIARVQGETEERSPLEISGCSYCAGLDDDTHPYDNHWRMARDIKDFRICIEHVLKRCEEYVPEKPKAQKFDSWMEPSTTFSANAINARIDARIAEHRAATTRRNRQNLR